VVLVDLAVVVVVMAVVVVIVKVLLIIIFINCGWVVTRWQWSFYIV
jgi:hypothetical protein